jgi:hypothetical protein
MRDITKEEIRSEIMSYVPEGGELAYPVKFASFEEAVNDSVEKLHSRINDFGVLDQDTIELQEINYDGYLDGAKPGDWVWGDDEMWVSQGVIEGWHQQSFDSINNEYSNDVDNVSNHVENVLILKVLEEANKDNSDEQ